VSRWLKVGRLLPILLLVAVALTGCSLTGEETGSLIDVEHATPLAPQGSVADGQLSLINQSLGIMTTVLVVVFALFFYAVIRFRKRKGQNDIPKQVEGNHVLEIIWTVIPIILVTILAIPTIYYTVKFADDYSKSKDAVQVDVTAKLYWWQFNYKNEGINTAQELVIPVNTKVAVTLTSTDVIHSFWIPGLAGKTDAAPGMVNKMYFDAKKPGIYRGKCAELCGPSHALMDFKVIVKTKEDYKAWVASMKKPAEVVAGTEKGAEIFKAKCMTCHAVDATKPGLFPNLANFGDRELVGGYLDNQGAEAKDNLTKWINDPTSVKQVSGIQKEKGLAMPTAKQLGLSDSDVEELVNYLHSLKK
jgi:cytochrome c oxidase subunit II